MQDIPANKVFNDTGYGSVIFKCPDCYLLLGNAGIIMYDIQNQALVYGDIKAAGYYAFLSKLSVGFNRFFDTIKDCMFRLRHYIYLVM